MRKFIDRSMRAFFPALSIPVVRSLRNFRRLAFGHGQWRSIRQGKSVDALGMPVPWYTYPAIEYLRSFNFKDCDVFEFGAGNSSFFWSKHARSVVSVEDDKDWFERVNSMALGNQSVVHRSQENDYVKSLSEQGKRFHIIVIDGKWRRRCADEAIPYLEEGGMIVLDNSDWYTESSRFFRERGFFQIDFSGFGPINGYCWTTSIFIKAQTSLQRNFASPSPIGGTKQQAD